MKLPVVALAALLLAGCNSQTGAGNAAGANGAAMTATAATNAPAAPDRMLPGRWEITVRVASVEMPGASPEAQAQLRARPLPPAQVQANCVTPEEAVNPVASFQRELTKDQPNLACDIGERAFGGGRIRIALSCRTPDGQTEQRLAMVGSFTDSNVQAAISMDATTPGADGRPQAVCAQSTFTGRRVGECTGTETD
jgi:predicted small secreted protein